jgi:hypothetical protein
MSENVWDSAAISDKELLKYFVPYVSATTE